MQPDGTLDHCPFRGPLYINAKAPIEQLLQNTHKHVSRLNDFNKSKDTSKNTVPTQDIISRPCPKVTSVRFDEPYDHIHHMEHTNEENHIIDTK